jgi:hypothetical protein
MKWINKHDILTIAIVMIIFILITITLIVIGAINGQIIIPAVF